MANTEGLIPIQAPLEPNNQNPRMYTTESKYIKGAPIIVQSIEDLVGKHPNLMVKGNNARVYNFPAANSVSDFILNSEPDSMVDVSGNTLVTIDNFSSFWELQDQTNTSGRRVQQYSPDGPGGGIPVYPYTPSEEGNWTNTYDPTKGHRWTRFRDDDIDDDSDGIYDNWTVPIPITSSFSTGDYIENRFRREAVSGTVHTAEGTLINGKYYSVEVGSFHIVGDTSLNDTGDFIATTDITLGIGRTFKYVPGNTYTFNDSCTLIETLKTPPRSLGGVTNDSPVGWSDTIPPGSLQLWEITGQKSVYGKLKSPWVLKKILENPNYIRYSDNPLPDPGTIADVNTTIAPGSAEDLDLIALGWTTVYDEQSFIARRTDDPGANLYTPWIIEKINEESGEYTDRVFKLFSINLDSDSPEVGAPTGRDASAEGWTDSPQQETENEINFVSEARKFFDGTLKTPWSTPVPYTGRDAYNDYIGASPADNFKYDQDEVVTPEEITLTAYLNKGTTNLWESAVVNISYAWKMVFDDGAPVDVSPTTNPADPFYTLPDDGTPGTPGYLRDSQRVVVTAAAVNGTTVFRCTQTITFASGDPLIFEDEFTLIDVTDGKDAKSLVLTSDLERVVWDSVNSVFNPTVVTMRAYSANIPSIVYHWFKYNTGTLAWDAISNGAVYAITGATCQIVDLVAAGFVADDTSQELRFAVSTKTTTPETADYETEFTDYQTIVKLGSLSTGAAGLDALTIVLSNESHTIVLDAVTGAPQAGEIGTGLKASTKISLYDGPTQKLFGTDWTINIPAVPNVTLGTVDLGTDAQVSVTAWLANLRSATVNIDITYGSFVVRKVFSVSTSKDAPGALVLDVDSTNGYIWGAGDVANKSITLHLYDTNLPGTAEVAYDGTYEFRMDAGSWQTSNLFTVTIPGPGVTSVTHTFYTRKASAPGTILRSKTIGFTKVQSGKIFIAWTATVATLAQVKARKLTTQGGPLAGGGVSIGSSPAVVWYDYQNALFAGGAVPLFQQLGQEDAGGSTTWGLPTQITGEKGDQGGQGGFLFNMYKSVGVTPQTPPSPPTPIIPSITTSWTITQMISNGWTAKPPNAVPNQLIWTTSRRMLSQLTAPGSTVVQFDTNGYPYYNGTPGNYDSGLTADPWGPATQLTGIPAGDPVGGSPGVAGPGWTTVTELAPSGNGDRNYRLNPVNGASAAFFTAPKGDVTVFQAGAILANTNPMLQSVGFSDSNFIEYSGGSWTNTTAFTVCVDLEVECRAYNTASGHASPGSAALLLRSFINGVLTTSNDTAIDYNTDIPKTLRTRHLATVAPGQTLSWNARASALFAPPNNLSVGCAFKVIIIA